MALSSQQLGIVSVLLSSFIPCVLNYGMDPEWGAFNGQRGMDFLDNTMSYGGNRSQFGRLFNLNKEDSKIKVELGFAIPFLSIPINTKPKNGRNFIVDVNFGALAAGGLLSAASVILIPSIVEGLGSKLFSGRSSKANNEESELFGFLSRMDDALMSHNIDSSTCTQRAVCWLINSAVKKVNNGTGGSMDKIVDGFASNPWLEHMIKGTAIQEAISNGRKGRNCSAMYSKCPITQDQLRRVATKIWSNIY